MLKSLEFININPNNSEFINIPQPEKVKQSRVKKISSTSTIECVKQSKSLEGLKQSRVKKTKTENPTAIRLTESLNSKGSDNLALESKPAFNKVSIGPSSFGKNCPRAIWFKSKHFPEKPLTPKSYFTFEIGHKTEEIITSYLQKCGFKLSHILEEQLNLQDPTKLINCYCDGIIEQHPYSKTRLLLEMKTANNKNFNNIKKELVEFPEVIELSDINFIGCHKSHYIQIQTYLYFLKTLDLGFSDIESCFYVVLNKDTSELYTNVVKYDGKTGEYFYNKILEIILGPYPKLTQAEIKSMKFTDCMFCDFQDYCAGFNHTNNCFGCKHLKINKDPENRLICDCGNNTLNIEDIFIPTCSNYYSML